MLLIWQLTVVQQLHVHLNSHHLISESIIVHSGIFAYSDEVKHSCGEIGAGFLVFVFQGISVKDMVVVNWVYYVQVSNVKSRSKFSHEFPLTDPLALVIVVITRNLCYSQTEKLKEYIRY